MAKQTGQLVLAISQRRDLISLYKGNFRYTLRDVGVILAKANQALSTLEKYRAVFQQSLTNLTALEFEELATLYDVTTCIQRAQMVHRIRMEIERYIVELGTEGPPGAHAAGGDRRRTFRTKGISSCATIGSRKEDETAADVWQSLNEWSSDDLLELTLIARRLGYASHMNNLDYSVTPQGVSGVDESAAAAHAGHRKLGAGVRRAAGHYERVRWRSWTTSRASAKCGPGPSRKDCGGCGSRRCWTDNLSVNRGGDGRED